MAKFFSQTHPRLDMMCGVYWLCRLLLSPPHGHRYNLTTTSNTLTSPILSFRLLSSSPYGTPRRVLPEDMARNVLKLDCPNVHGGLCDVYVVGTAHVSKESCREVRAIINYLKPQVVFLELCASRAAKLKHLKSVKVPTLYEMIDAWKNRRENLVGILYGWFLAKVASTLKVLPGSEFRAAYEEAISYGAKVELGDRPIHITLQRTWRNMPLLHKAKFVWNISLQTAFLPSPEQLNEFLREMEGADLKGKKDKDPMTLMVEEMSKTFPTMMETLLHERDMYMSHMLLQVARNHSLVVAVVGKGHLRGIEKHWEQPIEIEPLLQIPASSRLSGMKKLALVGVGAAVTGICVSLKK